MRIRLRLSGTILLIIAMIVNGTALAVPDVIRLHVIANSDSVEDQRVKEQVRDRIIEVLGPDFTMMKQDQVAQWIVNHKTTIADLAEEVLTGAGHDYPVNVNYNVVSYPTRVYGLEAYPAGKYRSLRIELGSGAGRNWWCIMFPPLCFVNETVKATEDNSEDLEVRFWLLDKISAWFKNWGEKDD